MRITNRKYLGEARSVDSHADLPLRRLSIARTCSAHIGGTGRQGERVDDGLGENVPHRDVALPRCIALLALCFIASQVAALFVPWCGYLVIFISPKQHCDCTSPQSSLNGRFWAPRSWMTLRTVYSREKLGGIALVEF